MYNEIHNSLTNFPPYFFGFRMGYSTEQCLNVMLEQWEKTLNQKNYVCQDLSDLSKPFDCIDRKHLIAK